MALKGVIKTFCLNFGPRASRQEWGREGLGLCPGAACLLCKPKEGSRRKTLVASPPPPHPLYIQRRSAEVMGAGKTSQNQEAVRHPPYKPKVVDTCDMIPFPPPTHLELGSWFTPRVCFEGRFLLTYCAPVSTGFE